MSNRVLIPTPLRPYADHEREIHLEGRTVGELLDALTSRHDGLRAQLYDERGALRSFVNVYVNDEDIRNLEREETEVGEGDVVSIVPAVAGGSREGDAAGSGPGRADGGPDLSKEEIRRYSRHLIMPEVGMEGQKRLKAGSVLLVGTGGLGSPMALYLAAAGVGRIGLVDFDRVDESNLQRQVIHGTKDVGRSKLESARESILDVNPHVRVELFDARLSRENALEILRPYDVVADGTDNFPTRYLVNDACVLLGKPNVYGSIFRFEGQASVFWAERGPCYRCLYPEPPPPGLVPSCAEGGVLGILPGVVGLVQATEVIKLLLGAGDPLIGRLLLFDALGMHFREMKLRKNTACPLCGENPTITELIDYEGFCGVPAEGSEEPAHAFGTEEDHLEISVAELRELQTGGGDVQLVDVREPHEWEICRIEGAQLIPMSSIPESLERLDPERPLVCYCHTGVRSANVAAFLRQNGFGRARTLAGGIDEWAATVEPSMPRY
jgi:molybdopterin/thiamine biosynthesis adenylyltransferase/rhodanese-related sulfurtransferase/molybdopterin converting factor small subunit